MATASPPPSLSHWTCLDLPMATSISDNASGSNTDTNADADVYSINSEIGTNSTMSYRTFYGPGELETYRHAQLQKDVKDAKLKVWYPGQWHRHSPRACFRTMFNENIAQAFNDNDFQEEVVFLKFRSNATITFVRWNDSSLKQFDCKDIDVGDAKKSSDNSRLVTSNQATGRNQIQLSWKSTLQTIDDTRVYDHVLLFSFRGNNGANKDPPRDILNDGSDAKSAPAFVVMELDTRPPSSPVHNDDAVEDDCDLETKIIHPPPCITLQATNSSTSKSNNITRCQLGESHSWEWQWRNHGDEEWIPISYCWASPLNLHELQQVQRGKSGDEHQPSNSTPITHKCSADYAGNDEASWLFPHQQDLSIVSNVHPISKAPHSEVDCADGDLIIVYDFGKELLGKVHISIPVSSSSLTGLAQTVTIRVGESMEEAMNDDEDHFEQCLDLCYQLVQESIDEEESVPRHDWRSCHLLAFRYVRVICANTEQSKQLAVSCQSYLPSIKLCGSFSCGNGVGSSVAKLNGNQNQLQNDELDAKIWRYSADTLQLCVHNNFIVDGIKRDRLPWAGDLAVSLMANAYSFSDNECVRWTLTILGRCGMDKLGPTDGDDTNEEGDGPHAATKDSHINGIIDYSLWGIISHWLYQRYFGDAHFLKQEWRLVERRLTHLIKGCSNEETGWLKTNDDDWVFIDWIVDGDKSISLQILWWYALDCGVSLAQRMTDLMEEGKKQKMSHVISLFSGMQSKLEDSFLKMQDVQLGFSRHAHILGVLSGLYTRLDDRASDGDWSNPDSSDERWQTLRRCRTLYNRSRGALMSDIMRPVATPYMKHLETLAISRLGERISALERVRSYWGGMIDKNATTFFEAFNENETSSDVAKFYDRPFGRSLCHAWATGPCALYPEILLGVRPLNDGWEQWQCDPLIECMESVSATVKTSFGVISVQLDSDNLEVLVPEGTTMVLMDKNYTCGKHQFPRNHLISSQTVRRWSEKYRGWHHHATHLIGPNPQVPGYEGIQMTDVPTVYQLPDSDPTTKPTGNRLAHLDLHMTPNQSTSRFYMSFIGFDGVGYQTFVAESSDLLEWTNIRLAMGYGEESSFDHGGVVLGAFLYQDYSIASPRTLKRKNGKYYSLYGAYAKKGTYEPDPGYQGLASSEDGTVWMREKDESILSIYGPGIVKQWEKDSIYQPWLLEHNGVYYNFYNAKEMPQWIEQIGLATSKDLYSWTRHDDNPILCVGKRTSSAINDCFDTQFASDAKVFWDEEESHWVMFYFGVGKGGAHIQVAFSRDLAGPWVRDSTPLYTAGENSSGLDKQYAHKISLVLNPRNNMWYMFYCAVGDAGRGIGLITSQPLW